MRLAETVRTVASTKLVAACLVRDAGSYLERNLLAMLEMGRAFAAFRLLYLENDSADDGTRDILRRLERTSQPMIRLLSGDLTLWVDEENPCGRTYPRLPQGIFGRIDDMFTIEPPPRRFIAARP